MRNKTIGSIAVLCGLFLAVSPVSVVHEERLFPDHEVLKAAPAIAFDIIDLQKIVHVALNDASVPLVPRNHTEHAVREFSIARGHSPEKMVMVRGPTATSVTGKIPFSRDRTA